MDHWHIHKDVDRFPEGHWSWTDNQLVNPLKMALGRVVIRLRGLPTSRNHPERLSATYHADVPPALTIAPSTPIRLTVLATNTGEAVWLASARDDPWAGDGAGVVRLGWLWYDGQRLIAGGRSPLYLDVFSHESYEFRAVIDPPREPGTYVLEVGLVSELVAWFSGLGTLPIRVTVGVVTAG